MEMPELKIGHLVSGLPIIQGGMGVKISMAGLASAVANQGGIGVIATIMIGINEPGIATNASQANTDALKREIRKKFKYFGLEELNPKVNKMSLSSSPVTQ